MSGGAAKLREGRRRARPSLTAKAFDTGYHFMLIELGKDAMNFQAINEEGKVVDSAALPRFSDADKKKMAVSDPDLGPSVTTGNPAGPSNVFVRTGPAGRRHVTVEASVWEERATEAANPGLRRVRHAPCRA